MKLQKIIDDLEYLINEDCTDTQFDYADSIDCAIEILEKVKRFVIDVF